MAALSRTKGQAGERELAKLLTMALGVDLQRNLEQARIGGHDLTLVPGQSDPLAQAMDAFALECKRYHRVTPGKLAAWWTQATRQAEAAHKLPALAYRADRGRWIVQVGWNALHAALPSDKTLLLSLDGFAALIQWRASTAAPGGNT